MRLIPDGSVDAIIADPPYGTTACKWDSVIPFDLMWEQLNRVIKPFYNFQIKAVRDILSIPLKSL